MIEATYLDNSGSTSLASVIVGKIHTFGHEVDSPPNSGTSFGPVFAHARESGYKSIRMVTDGYGEFDARNIDDRPVFTDLAIEWVIM